MFLYDVVSGGMRTKEELRPFAAKYHSAHLGRFYGSKRERDVVILFQHKKKNEVISILKHYGTD